MLKKEKIEVPATTKIVHTLYCDLCGEDLDNQQRGYDSNSATVEAKIGPVYPEGDQREYYGLDVCAKCFMDKVKPVLERELNVKFHEYDEDRLWR